MAAKLTIDRKPVFEISASADESAFAANQWRQYARTTNVTEAYDAKRLVKGLLGVRKTTNPALRAHVAGLDARIGELEASIAVQEAEMNELVMGLYVLSDDERQTVARG